MVGHNQATHLLETDAYARLLAETRAEYVARALGGTELVAAHGKLVVSQVLASVTPQLTDARAGLWLEPTLLAGLTKAPAVTPTSPMTLGSLALSQDQALTLGRSATQRAQLTGLGLLRSVELVPQSLALLPVTSEGGLATTAANRSPYSAATIGARLTRGFKALGVSLEAKDPLEGGVGRGLRAQLTLGPSLRSVSLLEQASRPTAASSVAFEPRVRLLSNLGLNLWVNRLWVGG